MRTFPLATLGAVLLVIPAVMVSSSPQAETGTSVWSGVYTADQAKRGADLYGKACASCHGDQLEGLGQAPGLTGADFMDKWEKQTAGDLFDAMKATMPADKPGSLSAAQNADLVAYLFQKSQFPAGKAELPADSEKLKKITIEAKKQ